MSVQTEGGTGARRQAGAALRTGGVAERPGELQDGGWPSPYWLTSPVLPGVSLLSVVPSKGASLKAPQAACVWPGTVTPVCSDGGSLASQERACLLQPVERKPLSLQASGTSQSLQHEVRALQCLLSAQEAARALLN